MVKFVHDVFLPDDDTYLERDILVSPRFMGGGTIQFKKFAAAMPLIRQFRHAVDIGANVGLWSRVLVRCFDQLTAFEPNLHCQEAFWLNVNHPDRRDDRVTLHQCALGNEKGKLHFSSQKKSTAFTHADPQGDMVFPVQRLDDFALTEVDLIKIDVEGFEYFVVLGGGETIQRWHPVMILEQKPGNAEQHGVAQFAAMKLLCKWGAAMEADIGGDLIMRWPKQR